MNDDTALAAVRDRLAVLRDSLGEAQPSIPASEIIARARRRRARRWLASTAAACAAIGLAVALMLPSASQARPVHVHLAAWSVDTQPNGTVTFNLRNTSQPARLQHVLAEAGVPAMIRWREICLAQGRHALLGTQGFVKLSGNTAPARRQPESYFAIGGGDNFWPDWSWTITPAKIPPGAQFVISAVPLDRARPNQIQAVWEFVRSSAPVTCAKSVKL